MFRASLVLSIEYLGPDLELLVAVGSQCRAGLIIRELGGELSESGFKVPLLGASFSKSDSRRIFSFGIG